MIKSSIIEQECVKISLKNEGVLVIFTSDGKEVDLSLAGKVEDIIFALTALIEKVSELANIDYESVFKEILKIHIMSEGERDGKEE